MTLIRSTPSKIAIFPLICQNHIATAACLHAHAGLPAGKTLPSCALDSPRLQTELIQKIRFHILSRSTAPEAKQCVPGHCEPVCSTVELETGFLSNGVLQKLPAQLGLQPWIALPLTADNPSITAQSDPIRQQLLHHAVGRSLATGSGTPYHEHRYRQQHDGQQKISQRPGSNDRYAFSHLIGA